MAQSVACPLPKPPKGRENSKKVWIFFQIFFGGLTPRIAPQHKEHLYEKNFAYHSFCLYACAFAFRVR